MPFHIPPNDPLISRVRETSNNFLELASHLQDAPKDLEVEEFLKWSTDADSTLRGLLSAIGDLREHYSRFLRKKNGEIVDRDDIPM